MNKISFLTLPFIVTALIPSITKAQEFDPNYILSDEDLTAVHAMSRTDIDNFLNTQTGSLGSRFFRDQNGLQQSATDIIYKAAHTHNINPRVLLVMLQKEQSLITNPFPKLTQLQWATGYAVCDACNVHDPHVQKHAGFANQVDAAAGSFRYYLENYRTQQWIKRAGINYTIDNTSVTPSTNATAFLYTYTPHIEGNKNFRNIWRSWFEKTYPDGLLIKTHDQPDVWYLENGMRRHIASMRVLNSYFSHTHIKIVDTADLASIPVGLPLNYPNYSLLKDGEKVFLLVDNELLYFASQNAIRELGFNPEEIIHVTEADLTQYKRGTILTSASNYPTGAIMQTRQSKQTFFVKNGRKYPIIHPEILKTRFANEIPVVVNDAGMIDFIDDKPIVFPDGVLIAQKDTQEIYLISNSQRRHIVNEQVFANLGFTFNDVHWVDETTLNLHTEGEPII